MQQNLSTVAAINPHNADEEYHRVFPDFPGALLLAAVWEEGKSLNRNEGS
jgi:hypothetical protein